jgi:hypothetical protein
MKHWLSGLNVAFRVIDVGTVPEARRIVRALTRGDTIVPTLILENGRVLIEPDRDALVEALRQRPR